MALASRGNGCIECRRRRIRCDKVEPTCGKCIKKGIRCSGQGLEFRSHQRTVKVTCIAPVKVEAREESVAEEASRYSETSASRTVSTPPIVVVDGDEDEVMKYVNIARTLSVWRNDFQTNPLGVNYASRISQYMVAFDERWNGYRQVIMKHAATDARVKQAIAVVSAHHLSSDINGLGDWASRQQYALIAQMRERASSSGGHSRVTMSEWMVVLLLLVGETVTGGPDFVHLLKILKAIESSLQYDPSIPLAVREFLIAQTRMFELFGLPLADPHRALDSFHNRDLDSYLGFLANPIEDADPRRNRTRGLLRDAVLMAFHIYLGRATHHNGSSSYDPTLQIEALKQKVMHITWKDEGAHALVWSYFIAAAESRLSDHQIFFEARLSELFAVAKFRNIPKAIALLHEIWQDTSGRPWTEIIKEKGPVLIM